MNEDQSYVLAQTLRGEDTRIFNCGNRPLLAFRNGSDEFDATGDTTNLVLVGSKQKIQKPVPVMTITFCLGKDQKAGLGSCCCYYNLSFVQCIEEHVVNVPLETTRYATATIATEIVVNFIVTIESERGENLTGMASKRKF